MDVRYGRVAAATGFLHRHFLILLVGAYALAAIVPAAGLWLGTLYREGHAVGRDVRISAPAVMLGFLLFAAGLGVRGDHLRGLFRRPGALALGLLAILLVPVLILVIGAPVLAFWPDPAEARDLLIGLAIVTAMPVAGSSAGWSRAADGDCALSLGLVLLSTLASPVSTPLALHAAGAADPGGAGGALGQLADAGGAGVFLALWVVLPTLAGVLTRWTVGSARVDAAGAGSRLATSVVLLVLCYVNASACLPGAVADPDWDFLALVVLAAGLMCAARFAAGFGVAGVVRADPARRASLVFGVGMANNGTGLVLASTALTASPMAVLPVVAMNLIQHLMAGAAGRRLAARCEKDEGRGGDALERQPEPRDGHHEPRVRDPRPKVIEFVSANPSPGG
ncbi:MAG: Sodium Bile acid symporter family protein [Gemmataceae bacterium]|nr:Sodium Bile acid symporter family protein [Gemmataceae bacterium]